MTFTGLCLLDGLFTFVLLVFIEAYRGLIETSNVIISLFIIRYHLIGWSVCKHLLIISLFIISTVIGEALTFLLWEFTHVITYHSAIIMKDIFSRTLIIILHSQLVNVHSLSTIVSPVWMMYIFSETCSALVVIAFVLVVVIVNIYWPFYMTKYIYRQFHGWL